MRRLLYGRGGGCSGRRPWLSVSCAMACSHSLQQPAGMWQGSLGCTDGLAVHRALLSGCKRVLILIACLLPEPSSAHSPLCLFLASISTTLARNRTRPTCLVLSLPKESRAEHHCWASNKTTLGTGLVCLWSRSPLCARDKLRDKDLRVNTTHFIYTRRVID